MYQNSPSSWQLCRRDLTDGSIPRHSFDLNRQTVVVFNKAIWYYFKNNFPHLHNILTHHSRVPSTPPLPKGFWCATALWAFLCSPPGQRMCINVNNNELSVIGWVSCQSKCSTHLFHSSNRVCVAFHQFFKGDRLHVKETCNLKVNIKWTLVLLNILPSINPNMRIYKFG